MSYRTRSLLSTFGTVDSWESSIHVVNESDVIVLRMRISGARLSEPSDALLFVRAAGQGQNWGMDVRGVAVSDVASSTDQMVDVVFTKSDAGLLGWSPAVMLGMADDAASMAKNVAADEAIQQAFPKLSIASSQLGPLTGPADAIDHWRSQPVVWDHLLAGPKGRGGPTDTFAQPAEYTVVKGTADDGKRAQSWKTSLLGYGRQVINQLTPTQIGLIVGGSMLVGFVGWTMIRK